MRKYKNCLAIGDGGIRFGSRRAERSRVVGSSGRRGSEHVRDGGAGGERI